MSSSIFISQSQLPQDISGKITQTSILETIPKGSHPEPLPNWQDNHKTEWRWRFLELGERHVVEISYQKAGEKRFYYNRYGDWVNREIDKRYDQFVTSKYHFYTS